MYPSSRFEQDKIDHSSLLRCLSLSYIISYLKNYFILISLHNHINDSGKMAPPCFPLCVPLPFSNLYSYPLYFNADSISRFASHQSPCSLFRSLLPSCIKILISFFLCFRIIDG